MKSKKQLQKDQREIAEKHKEILGHVNGFFCFLNQGPECVLTIQMLVESFIRDNSAQLGSDFYQKRIINALEINTLLVSLGQLVHDCNEIELWPEEVESCEN